MAKWIDSKIKSPPKDGRLFLACYEYISWERKYEKDISLCKWYEENDNMMEGFYNYEYGPYVLNPIYWMKIPHLDFFIG